MMAIERIKKLLDTINNNETLKDQINRFSDLIFLTEPDFSFSDDFEEPETDWSIDRICTFAEDGSGGRFYLLADGSIGFESSEGQADRLAENIDDFLMLAVYCPYWMDLCGARSRMYLQDRLGFCASSEKERVKFFAEDGMDYYEIQKEIARALKLTPPLSSSDVSENFFVAATREPRFFGLCREDGNPETWETERLFEQ